MKLDLDIKGITPSLQVAVIHKGKVVHKSKMGEKAQYFDLASLTKIIFTVSEIAELIKKNKLKLTDPVQKYWPEFKHKSVRIRDLLTHTAGFKDWQPYYIKLRNIKGVTAQREKLRELLLKEKRSFRKKAVYSDIDFLILSVVIENIHGASLESIWKKRAKDMGLTAIHFNSMNKPKKARMSYAKTEKCKWRKKHLRGEVHDDNTWSLGGVSTHAGLFGRLEDMIKYAQWVRKQSQRNLIFKRLMKRAIPKSKGDWAMGFMMPSKAGSAGKHFSPQSFGHTGFTGTSFWYDPKKDLAVVILSNRVSPTRKNIKFRKLRPIIHDWAVECLLLKK